MRKNKFIIWVFICLIISILYPFNISAQSEQDYGVANKSQRERKKAENENKKNENKIKWEIHRSITNIFETKFPKDYKYKIFPFQFNNDTIAFSAEIISSLDGLASKKKEKSISIKVVQTFGGELGYWDVKKALKREVQKYKQAAKFIDGVMLTNEDIKNKGFIGKDIYITYKVKEEKYGLRIVVYMTNYSKIELTISGPAHTMYSYRSDDFFDSIKPMDGIMKKENPIGVGWVAYPSKNNIFTAVLPPKNKDYTPGLPRFRATPRNETMNFDIIDPILEKDIIYNIYSYVVDKRFSLGKVKDILFAKHISNFVKTGGASSITTENTIVDGVTTMKTKLIVSPTEEYPDVTTLFYEAKFKNNILVIQEVLSTNSHTKSGLSRTLFSLMKFHPDKYKAITATKTKDN